ncbi:methyltransferase domain-containing protein [Colletotrichum incanum]|uniref:Methyltransferase domain-containing protein n=1 Tax=Colletotrichum incanum TaxID=1573173 RepID=A0A162NKI6_COLIC|nr:methyltransferase domain-containing protein [Colletotrichum incanum]OHW95742.1 methyltransferase domain-containing protein [Colletotrichum incanum]
MSTQQQDQPQVQTDESVADDSSSIGGCSTDESQASLRSSILDYRRENGRTYHSMSDGKYAFPNDEQEQKRLDINDRTTAKRVLDLGTGTGIWALDYADAHPEATVFGVDLSPIQPGYVPPNCIFEIDDLEKEWTWTKPFDFIFARNMNGSFANWEGVLAQAYGHLEPGGYLEIQDSLWPPVCDDDTFKEDSAFYRWSRLLVEACNKIGRPVDKTGELPMKMEAAGFEDIHTTRIRFPASPWPKDKKLKELGIWNQEQLLPGLEALTLGLFTRVLDWSKEETIVFCANARKDLKDTKAHAYWNGYVMYGRKPLKVDEE